MWFGQRGWSECQPQATYNITHSKTYQLFSFGSSTSSTLHRKTTAQTLLGPLVLACPIYSHLSVLRKWCPISLKSAKLWSSYQLCLVKKTHNICQISWISSVNLFFCPFLFISIGKAHHTRCWKHNCEHLFAFGQKNIWYQSVLVDHIHNPNLSQRYWISMVLRNVHGFQQWDAILSQCCEEILAHIPMENCHN